MTQTLELYLTRANEAAAEAKLATLDNVRDRCLRAEAAWRDMAERQAKIERLRRDREESAAEAAAERIASA